MSESTEGPMETDQFCADSLGQAISSLLGHLSLCKPDEAPDLAKTALELVKELWAYSQAPVAGELQAIKEELKGLAAFKELMSAKGFFQNILPQKQMPMGRVLG